MTANGNGKSYADPWAERIHAFQRLSISVVAVGALGWGFVRCLDALVAMCEAVRHLQN